MPLAHAHEEPHEQNIEGNCSARNYCKKLSFEAFGAETLPGHFGLPGRCWDAAGTLPGRSRDVAGMLPGRCRDVAGTLPEHCGDVAGTLSGRFRDTAGTLPGRCRDVDGTLPGRCRDVAGEGDRMEKSGTERQERERILAHFNHLWRIWNGRSGIGGRRRGQRDRRGSAFWRTLVI